MAARNNLKLKQITAGEWQRPIHRGYRLSCCDCGLVHRMDFKVEGDDVLFRVYLDPKTTKQERQCLKKRAQ